ncbi:MAG: hypothetical protein ACOVQ4_12245 [Flectobacillus sp.]|uniref:hypothetical protein n=1 Tax=Flectobacillus sp. TaxID=50419 RepID=UPI003B9BA33F
MDEQMFKGMGEALKILIAITVVLVAVFVKGCDEIMDWADSTEIKSEKPLTPTLELRIIDNKVDTLYVYRKQ